MGQFDAWENEIQKSGKVTNQFDEWESELQKQPEKAASQFDEWEKEINLVEKQPSVLDMPPVQQPQPLMTGMDFVKSAAADLPVAASNLGSGIAGFGADVLKGTAKAIDALPLKALQSINPQFQNETAEQIAEARRQGIDITADTLKNMYAEAAKNTQQYYTGTRPEDENYTTAPAKSELLPDNYVERLAKAKGSPTPETPLFDNVPGGRELIQSAKAIPEFVSYSAEELGRIAGALSAGDVETAKQVLSKPFSTVGIPAVGVVTGPKMAIEAKRMAFDPTKVENVTETKISPEDQKYLDEYNKDIETAKAKIIEDPNAINPDSIPGAEQLKEEGKQIVSASPEAQQPPEVVPEGTNTIPTEQTAPIEQKTALPLELPNKEEMEVTSRQTPEDLLTRPKNVSQIVAEKKAEGFTGKPLAEAVREEAAAQKAHEINEYKVGSSDSSGAPPSSLFKGSNRRGAVSIGPIVDSIASSYKQLRDKLMEKRSKSKEISGSAVDNVVEFLWEKYRPALKEIEAKSGKAEATKVFEDIERQRYADNVIKSYLKDSGLIEEIFQTLNKNDISPDQYGVYNEARRVLFEPNPDKKPYRLTKQQALTALVEFKPNQQVALKKIHAKENAIRQTTLIPEWEKSEVFSDAIMNFMKNNDNYSRNVVAEYALKNVPKTDKMSGELLKRIGSTKDIFNPWEQKIIGDRATTQFASRQVAVRSVAEALERTGAAKDKPFDGSEPVEYMHKGQWETKYVPKDMAYAINYFPEEMSSGAKFLDWLVYQNPVSKLMEQQLVKNPGFILGNSMLLDPITTWWQLPDKKSIILYPMVHLLTVADKMGSKTARSIAKKLGLKEAVELNKEMTEQRIYNIGSLADRADEIGETQLASMLENLGLNSELLEFFGAPRSMWSKLADKTGFAKSWRKFEDVAMSADNTSKESLYNYLKRFRPDLSQAKINQMVREMGTPATKRTGTGSGIIGRTLQFGNAALQGGRATLKNFKDSPSTFLLKNMGMPVALAYGVYQWSQADPTAKKAFDQLSEYQKNNFLNFYLGEKDGKPFVTSFPLPRFARNIYALTMNMLEGDKSFGENAQTLIEGLGNMGFSEIPTTLKQPLRFTGDVAKYATGEPVYDSYRKQPVIPKRVQEADSTFYNKIFGDSKLNDLDTSKAFGKYLLNNYIMGGWFRYDPKKEVPGGALGLASQLPAVSRVIRIASGGVEKRFGDVINEDKKMKARAGLQLEKTAEQTIKEGKPLEISQDDLQALQISPKTLEYAMLKQIMRKMKKQDTSNFMKLLNAMQGQDQKTQLKLMKEYRKRGY